MTNENLLRPFAQLLIEAKDIKEQLNRHMSFSKAWPENLDAIHIILLLIELEDILTTATKLRKKLIKKPVVTQFESK